MMKRLMFLGVGACLMALAQAQPAAAITINFDDVADGTVINSQYAGVTFSNPLGGNVYAQAVPAVGGISAPNAVSILNGGLDYFFNATWGAVDATFTVAQSTVSIDVRAVGPVEFLGALLNRPFLEAYDSANVFLGRVLFAGALPTDCCFDFTPVETVTFSSASDNIARVRFSSQISQTGASVYGLFDNLTFGAPGNGSAVPEPASLLLLGAGFAGLAALRRRFQA